MAAPTEGPRWLLAELTYRCVLECAYCSNPLEYNDEPFRRELTGDQWSQLLEEARDLGCVQLGLSGGEPMLHPDVLEVVRRAADLGFYTSLITAGTPLDRETCRDLRRAGLDHVQVSLDGADPETNNRITNRECFEDKWRACENVRAVDFPLTLNVVLHRLNLGQVGALIDRAHELDADRIELANAQYHGWALANRSELMPPEEQLERAFETVEEKREQHGDLEIVWVLPDYHEEYPKPCMGGWARQYMVVAPGGQAYPCHSASSINSLEFPRYPDRSLEWIWVESPAFNAFRGTDWMVEPCVSCPRKEIDFGGCRCQAFALTGDARRADPVCHLSPDHDLIEQAVASAGETRGSDDGDLTFRNPRSAVPDLPVPHPHRSG